MKPRGVCTQCAGIVNYRTSKAITCVKCDQTYHRDCANLTVVKYEEILKNNLRWMCAVCNVEKQQQQLYVASDLDKDKETSEERRMMDVIINKLDLVLESQNVIKDEMAGLKAEMAELKKRMSEMKTETYDREVFSVGSRNTRKTYAETAGKESVLILKPKKNQNCAVTEKDVKKIIDPTKVNINNLRRMPSGGVAIEFVDVLKSKEMEEVVKENLGKNYEVTVPELKNPRIKIIGINEELTDDVLKNALESQNEFLKDKDMKIIKVFKTKRDDFTAIVELDAKTFEQCMKNKAVKVLWSRCNVFEDINVFRCFKCNGFNHKMANCKNDKSCQRCAENHDFQQCNSRVVACINCKSANRRHNLKLNENHVVTSEECTIYRRRVDAERRKTKYSM